MADDHALPAVPLDGPHAARLADLASVLQDLRFVIGSCDRLEPLVADDADSDPVLVRALWSSAVVAYSRCFATGKRLGLSEADVEAVEGDALKVHNYFREMRDKHIAHSVNPFEEIKVGALLGNDDDGNFGVVGVGYIAMSHVSGTPEGVNNLRLLSTQLAKRVSELGEDATTEVLAEAQTLDIEELRARKPMRVTASGPERASEARNG